MHANEGGIDDPSPDDVITTRSGHAIGRWNGEDADSLRIELSRIRKALAQDNNGDRVVPTGMPHANQVPDDLRGFRAYPIWGCDRSGLCVCGANANRLVSVGDIRQFSMIDHH